jgi:hypothetical protein
MHSARHPEQALGDPREIPIRQTKCRPFSETHYYCLSKQLQPFKECENHEESLIAIYGGLALQRIGNECRRGE